MKKFFVAFLFFLIQSQVFSQVLISPYILYTSNENRVANFIVQNESDDFYEIGVSFMFGYPTSDSSGQIVMKYLENNDSSKYSINDFIRAFPKKFILPPKKRQIVRITIKAPDTLANGTYWTRIITSATPYSEQPDTVSKGITARIKFVLNQVSTCIYRVDPAESGLVIDSIKVVNDSINTKLLIGLRRIGNSPFIGNLIIKVKDEKGNVLKEMNEYVPVYFNLNKQILLDNSEFEKGKKYFIHFTAVNTEKEDIPESTLKIIEVPDAQILVKFSEK